MKNNGIKKTAIFGGSFDPPHYGHIDIVKNLEKIFDKVIVMPSYISPFKTGADDAAVRFRLCKQVFGSDKTTVSRYEISKKSVSYSIDTAEYLSKKEKDTQLFWVIGSEELARLDEWKNIDGLKKLVTFYVVLRPGYAPKDERVKALKKRGIKIKFAKFTGLDISSAEIKIDKAFGKTNKFIPDCVRAVADRRGLFDPYGKYVDKLYEYGLKQSRIEHTYGVAVCGARLAKLYGGNVNDAVIACILHDIAKYVPIEKYADKVDLTDFPSPTVHSPIGAYIVKNELGESDEIARAVYAHTTGDENMSLLDEIVYLADKTEQGRNYDEVYYFRYLCEHDKNYAMYRILLEINEYKDRHNDSRQCEMTVRAIEKYKKLCEGVAAPEMPQITRAVNASAKTSGRSPEKKSQKEKRRTYDYTGSKGMAYAVADELDKHKAFDIDIIDLGDKTIVADYFVVASVTSATAVKALTGYAEDRLKKQFDSDPSRRDVNREWVALDYGAVIIHIFTDKMREFYNIERLWSDGGNIERFGD